MSAGNTDAEVSLCFCELSLVLAILIHLGVIVILMQDFRYSKEFIAWKDLLLLLEGETVKLPAPKNHFINDIVIKDDVPVFATSKSKITFKGPYNTEDERETEMMDSRWRIIKFNHVFQENDQKEIKACATCFAKLVLMAQ